MVGWRRLEADWRGDLILDPRTLHIPTVGHRFRHALQRLFVNDWLQESTDGRRCPQCRRAIVTDDLCESRCLALKVVIVWRKLCLHCRQEAIVDWRAHGETTTEATDEARIEGRCSHMSRNAIDHR